MPALRLAVVPLLLAALASPAIAARPDRASYERALARERQLTAEASQALPAEADLRAASVAFENVARRYPTSGYADNALLKAAELAEQLHQRFHREADAKRAITLYQWLAKEYPSSPLVKKARAAANAVETTDRLQAARSVPAKAPAPEAATVVAAAAAPRAIERTDASAASGTGSVAEATTPAGTPASGPGASLRLREVRRAVLPELVRVTLELDGEVTYHHERIEGPPRLFFDLKGAQPSPALQDAVLTWPDDVVRQVRMGRQPRNTTRVVLDLDGVSRYSVFTLYNPFRVVVDLERRSGKRMGEVPRVPTPSVRIEPAATSSEPGRQDGVTSRASAPATPVSEGAPPEPRIETPVAPGARAVSPDAQQRAAVDEVGSGGIAIDTHRRLTPEQPLLSKEIDLAPPPPPVAKAGPEASPAGVSPKAPQANATGGFSMARQLGLGISRIVIDPGHGGRDPGAVGKNVGEAELVLDVALRLEKLLLKQPGMDVVLTRRTDTFVALEERTAIANREQADLFLSIHANASRNAKARGVETYFLNFASTPDAEAVAARENSASARTMHNLPDIVRAIALNTKLDESRDLAHMVQDALVKRLSGQNRQLRSLGVKQAPFVVLIGAAMPSVLAEISFITHPQEAQLLRSNGYRQRIAEALHDAVLKYQRSLKAVSTVAQQ
jgi:N-acetylmuramoyl-L-alanine amidase